MLKSVEGEGGNSRGFRISDDAENAALFARFVRKNIDICVAFVVWEEGGGERLGGRRKIGEAEIDGVL